MDQAVFPMEKYDPLGFWMRSIERGMSDGTPLKGSRRFDAVVVGGGFTGLSSAIALAERGLSVAIVEKSVVGAGASGWNCGQVGLDLGLNAPTTFRLFGRERTRIYADLLKSAIANIREVAERSGEDFHYRDNGNLLAGVHERQRPFLEETARLFAEAGLPVEQIEREKLGALGIPSFVKFALHEKVGGALHPAKYVYALAKIAKSLGVAFFENSPVKRIQKGKAVVVKTEGGEVTADKAVVAGNAFAAEFGELRSSYLPYSVSVLVTEPLTREQRSRLDWHGEHPLHTAHKVIENIRFTPDGRLLIGTKRVQHGYGVRHPNPRNAESLNSLLRVLRERFPQLSDLQPATGWTGRVALSADTLPYFDALGGRRNVVAAGGYGGHGVAMASYSGQILAKMLCEEPLGDVEALVNRRRVPLPPEPFRWLISRAVKMSLEGADNKTDALIRAEAAQRRRRLVAVDGADQKTPLRTPLRRSLDRR